MISQKPFTLAVFCMFCISMNILAQPCIQPQNDWQLLKLNGPVHQVSARSYLIDSTENGLEKTGKIDYFTAPDQESDWTFGTSGFLVSASYYDPLNGKPDIRDSFELNKSGCPVVAWKFYPDQTGQRDSIQYVTARKQLIRTRYQENQKTLVIQTTYGNSGAVEERIYKPENLHQPQSITRFLYNKKGQRIAEQYFDNTGTFTGSDTLIYNAQLHTEKTVNSVDSSFTVTWLLPNQLPDHETRTNRLNVTRKQYIYQYDSHKNWIRRVTYYQGKPFILTERTIHYFAQ